MWPITTQGNNEMDSSSVPGNNDRHHFAAGQIIFNEGDEANEVYIIVSGEVEFLLNDAPIGMDGEGGIVGEMALINETVHSATARARTDCTLDTINRERFLALIERSPPFALHVMRVMADRLRLINELVSSRG